MTTHEVHSEPSVKTNTGLHPRRTRRPLAEMRACSATREIKSTLLQTVTLIPSVWPSELRRQVHELVHEDCVALANRIPDSDEDLQGTKVFDALAEATRVYAQGCELIQLFADYIPSCSPKR